MNREEIKNILLPSRDGLTDAADPQIAAALALAKADPELARWLEENQARHLALREKFRQIPAPAGLKEQIISEQAAATKIIFWRWNSVLAAAAIMVALIALAAFWFQPRPADDTTLAIFEKRMANVALRGYGMDLQTNNLAEIRVYLARNHAPSDFSLPAPLEKISLAGCAIEGWRDKKVAMICFHTGKSAAAREESDLWLFVVDSGSVKDTPGAARQLAKVNQLITAAWTQGGKLYLLGTAGDAQTIRQYL